jgi:histidine triad (HIT) family protein
MGGCIFCKIANNEIDSYCVYEDSSVKAFLDISPWTEGHTLVIPKEHYENIFDIPNDKFNKVMAAVKKLSSAYRKTFEDCDINIINSNGKNAQQDIFHFHVHIVPRYKLDEQKIKLKVNQSLKKNLSSTLNKIRGGVGK